MDPEVFSFVTCVTDEAEYQLCQEYIEGLSVPANSAVELVPIREAPSMAAGYNQALGLARGKYKIYLHQDVFILNPLFLLEIRRLFTEHPSLGLLGLAGVALLPPSGVWWEGGGVVAKVLENRGTVSSLVLGAAALPYSPVAAVDGIMMVTQYDLPWREDIFDGWHFYDASQSQEFRRAGYQVGVPPQEEPWCLHDCGPVINLDGFERYRRLFVEHYLSGDPPPPELS